jgi:predicted anti-sigma-YlaC factor YlaD
MAFEGMNMHGLIRQGVEEYLHGGPARKLPDGFEEHLRSCEECREEVSWMQEQSQLLRTLVPGREVDPVPGFYARVLDRIEVQQVVSPWSAFLDPLFGRRLAAASLMLAVLLGGYLVLNERLDSGVASSAAESIMAVEEHPPGLGQNLQRDRDTILVTLATYSE